MEDNKHKHGFKSPDGYFEKFEDALFQRLEEDALPDNSGFKVPEGYFDTLEEAVMHKVVSSVEDTKVIPIYRRKSWAYVAAVAACLALIFTVVNFDGKEMINVEDLELSAIESYLDSGNIRWDSDDVAALMDDEQIDDLQLSEDLLSEQDLEEYLLQNMEDTSLLIE